MTQTIQFINSVIIFVFKLLNSLKNLNHKLMSQLIKILNEKKFIPEI
jgi:hypothetical protein